MNKACMARQRQFPHIRHTFQCKTIIWYLEHFHVWMFVYLCNQTGHLPKKDCWLPPGGLLAGPCLLTNFDRFSIGGCRRESILKRGKGSLQQVLVALCKIRTLLPPRATNLIKYWSTGQFPLKGVRGKSILLPESFWPELQSGSMEKIYKSLLLGVTLLQWVIRTNLWPEILF